MKSATYIGPNEKFHGQTALLRDDQDAPGMVLVQFDKNPFWVGSTNLGSGWHQFRSEHWSIDTTITAAALPPSDLIDRLRQRGESIFDAARGEL